MDGATVYPAPALVYPIEVTSPSEFINACADAFIPLLGAVEIETTGADEYSNPLSLIWICEREPVDMIAVAIAPEPEFAFIVTVGSIVYPYPGLITKILSIEFPVCPERCVIIATAVAEMPFGEVEIETTGLDKYPVPSFIKSILETDFFLYEIR